MQPFTPAFHLGTPHGVVAAVHLPDSPAPVDASVLAELAPEEAAYASTLGGYVQVSFVGGRLALRAARRMVGAPLDAVLPDARGTPVLGRGWVASVSHKRTLAIAMVARDTEGTLGVDLEDLLPDRTSVTERVLRPEEVDAVSKLAPGLSWNATVLRFSMKESIYKALDPFVRRYVGFHEATVLPSLEGTAEIALHLAQGEGPFVVDGRFQWLEGRVMTSVRIRRA